MKMTKWYVMKTSFDVDACRNWCILVAGPMDYSSAYNQALSYARTRQNAVYSVVKMEEEE